MRYVKRRSCIRKYYAPPSTESKGRDRALDFAKGLVIILMLLGHCIQCMIPPELDFFENVVFKIIYSFHMPCFALISGIVFGKRLKSSNAYEYTGKRILGLVQSIIFGGLLIFLLVSALNLISKKGINLNDVLSSATSIWFLWSILAATVAVGVAIKISKNFIIRILVLIILALLVVTLPEGGNNLFMYPYFIFGWIVSTYDGSKIIKYAKKIRFIAIPVFIALLFFFEKKHYIYTTGIYSQDYNTAENLLINLFRYAIGFFGSVSVICGIKWIYKFYRKTPTAVKKIILNPIERLGEKSLQIYVLSIAVLSHYLTVLMSFLYGKFPEFGVFMFNNQILYNLVFTPLACAVYVFALYYGVKLLEKIRLSKIFFGR